MLIYERSTAFINHNKNELFNEGNDVYIVEASHRRESLQNTDSTEQGIVKSFIHIPNSIKSIAIVSYLPRSISMEKKIIISIFPVILSID